MQRSCVTWYVVASVVFLGACSDLERTLDLDQNGTTEPEGTNSFVACDQGDAGDSGSCAPNCACSPPTPNTGDPYADCVERVNQFRACVCLGPLARNAAGEACADQEARYDSQTGLAHSGFVNAICSPTGLAQNECPGWSSAQQTVSRCMQDMFNEGPPPSSPCTGSCFETYGHFINMTSTRYRSVACGFYTTASGEVWQTQNYFP
jgi:hypothetical protein